MPFSHAYVVFQKMLTDARKRQGLTQADVADRLKLPQSFVSKYENGERRLDVVEFLNVMNALDRDPVQFIQELRERIERDDADRNCGF